MEHQRRGEYSSRRPKKRHFCLWNRFVLALGYLALAYGLCRGIIYLLVLLNGSAA